MNILLATGLSQTEKEIKINLDRRGLVCRRCYHRAAVKAAVEQHGANVVVLGPSLQGEQDIMEDVIVPLRQRGIRIVFLPGDSKMPDTREWLEKLVSYGIYCYVFDPVTPASVLERLDKPGTLGDLPKTIKLSVTPEVNALLEGIQRETAVETKKRKGLLDKVNITKVFKPAEHDKNEGRNEFKHYENEGRRDFKTVNGKPTVLLGFGNEEINNWFAGAFGGDVEILGTISSFEEFKNDVIKKQPCIAILSRSDSAGGIPESDKMAEWAFDYVPFVIYIAGELDEQGSEINERLKAKGIERVISCPVGGFVSADELVFNIYNIINRIRDKADNSKEVSVKKPNLIQNKLAQILKQTAEKKTREKKKKERLRINHSEGIALEEKASTVLNENIKNPTAIVPGGVFVIVSPWRPGLAGRLAAHAVKMFSEIEGSEVSYIGGSKHSTGAVWLDISDEELMMSDWRVPGSQCPVKRGNLVIYAVDPSKNLNMESEVWSILKEARKSATYTVMDLADDMTLAERAAHQGRVVLLVILPGADPVELKVSQLWLRNMSEGKKNIITGIDLRGCPPMIPEDVKPKVIVRNNPADAISVVLRKNSRNEFVWN